MKRHSWHSGCAGCMAKIAELEEYIRQMREDIAPELLFPPEWKLLKSERMVLQGLIKNPVFRPSQFRYFRLRNRISRDDMRNLSVQIFHIREKLKHLDIEIINHSGVGYSLTWPSRDKILDGVEAYAKQVQKLMRRAK